MNENSGGTPNPLNPKTNTPNFAPESYDAELTEQTEITSEYNNNEAAETVSENYLNEYDSETSSSLEYGTNNTNGEELDTISYAEDYSETISPMDYDDSVNTISTGTTSTNEKPNFSRVSTKLDFSRPVDTEPISSQMPEIPTRDSSETENKVPVESISKMPEIPISESVPVEPKPVRHVSQARAIDGIIRRTNENSAKTTQAKGDSLNFVLPLPVPVAGEEPSNDTAVTTSNFDATPTPNPAESQNSDTLVAKDSIVATPKKKSKTGLIIGVILLVIAVACGVVAAVMLLMPTPDDRVQKAITRLVNRETPSNMMVSGKIALTNSDPTNGITGLSIDVDSKLATAQGAGSSTLGIVATLANGSNIDLTVDEVHTEDGDLYLKVNGLSSIVETMNTINSAASSESTTTSENATCPEGASDCLPTTYTSEVTNTVTAVFEVVDNEWLRIPSETLSGLSKPSGSSDSLTLGGLSSGLTLGGNSSQCLVSVMTNLGSYGSEIGKLYQKNPFITYSTDNLKIQKKKDNLYRLGINENSFAGFLNSLPNSSLANDLLSCANISITKQNLTPSDIAEIFASTPIVYVEVDNNYNFTRVYFDASITSNVPVTTQTTSIEDDGVTTIETTTESTETQTNTVNVTADFSISYPTAPITITEPGDYIEMQEFLQNLFTQMFGDITVVEQVETTSE